jgi:hypothetical protein
MKTNKKSASTMKVEALFCFKSLVGGAEFESATPWMSTKYSNQLN